MCKDANSILVEVVTVADVDDENRVGNNILSVAPHAKSMTAFNSCRKVTQSFSNPENCYDITRQLASFIVIKSTKRYGVS